MQSLAMACLAFALSVVAIHFGSKWLVKASTAITRYLRLSEAAAGAVLVASITSAPELFTSVFAALRRASHMAFGNIIGSNTANIPLILGLCSLVREFEVREEFVSRECVILILLALLVTGLVLADRTLVWWKGVVMLACYAAYILYAVKRRSDVDPASFKKSKLTRRNAAEFVIGAGLLLSGAFLLIDAGIAFVKILGLSELYIGLTFVALGCIVPEAAVSLHASLMGKQTISLGNVLGDNIITASLVLGLVALLRPMVATEAEVLLTILPMITMTGIVLAIAKFRRRVTRALGLSMIALYICVLTVQNLFQFV